MGPGGGSVGHHATQDPVAQMNTFRSYVSMLADPGSKDENKLKAAQALSEDLEVGELGLCPLHFMMVNIFFSYTEIYEYIMVFVNHGYC